MNLGRRSFRPLLSFTLLSQSFDARRHTLTRVAHCLQMSSENSSNRADSGNAFKGDSLDHSSPGCRQTPEFSWTESPQRGSASPECEFMEESSKPKGEQSGSKASSSDQTEWSYANNTSRLTLQEALRLLDRYGMQLSIS